jgi:hypothetical protein
MSDKPNDKPGHEPSNERISYYIDDLPAVTGIPRRTWWALKKSGLLTVKKSGRRNIVEVGEARRLIASLPTA